MYITFPKNTFRPDNQGCEEHTDLPSFYDNERHSIQSLDDIYFYNDDSLLSDDDLPVHTKPGWGGCDCG